VVGIKLIEVMCHGSAKIENVVSVGLCMVQLLLAKLMRAVEERVWMFEDIELSMMAE